VLPDFQSRRLDELLGIRPAVSGECSPENLEMPRLKVRVRPEEVKARGNAVMRGQRADNDAIAEGNGDFLSGQGGQRLIPGAVRGEIAAQE
jgi:hypothetical protein